MLTRAMLTCLTMIGAGALPSARVAADDEAQIRAPEDRLAAAAESRNLDVQSYVPNETQFVFDVIPPRQYVGAKAFRKD